MYKIAICDDNQIDSEITQIFVNEFLRSNSNYYKRISTHLYNAPNTLIEHIKNGSLFNIYLLDVLMPNMSGISVAKIIREHDKDAIIIFLTSSKDYTLDAFDVYAFQYLLKPILKSQLALVLNNALKKLNLSPIASLAIKTTDGTFNIPFKDILYIEHMNHVPYYHLVNKSLLIGTSIRTSFDKAIDVLLNTPYFLKTHQSFAINLEHVKLFDNHKFTMSDDSTIPISQVKLPIIKRLYLSYLESKGIKSTKQV